MSKHCSAALLDDKINMLGFLQSGGSPGKRSVKDGTAGPSGADTKSIQRYINSKKENDRPDVIFLGTDGACANTYFYRFFIYNLPLQSI